MSKDKKTIFKQLASEDWFGVKACPECNHQRQDSQVTVCPKCHCYVVAKNFHDKMKSRYNNKNWIKGWWLSGKEKLEYLKTIQRVRLLVLEHLETRQRKLGVLAQRGTLTSEQETELAYTKPQIAKFITGYGLFGQITDAIDKSDLNVKPADFVGALGKAAQQGAKNYKKGDDKQGLVGFLRTLVGGLTDALQPKDDPETEEVKSEPSEAEKSGQEYDDRRRQRDTIKQKSDKEIDELEKACLDLEEYIEDLEELEKIRPNKERAKDIQLKKSKLQRMTEDLTALKQKRKSMSG